MVAAWLVPVFGWKALFVAGGVVPIIVALVIQWKLPESLLYLTYRGRNRREIEARVRELLNDHIKATSVTILVEGLDIFDTEAFDAAVEALTEPRAKADTILSHAQRTISEKMDENPAFYRRLSEMIDETIQAYRDERLSELDFNQRAEAIRDLLRKGEGEALPEALAGQRDAFAYYGVLTSYLEQSADWTIEAALSAESIIEQHKIRDWVGNPDVENRMKRAIDDVLYEFLRQSDIALSDERLNALIEALVMVARKRDGL